MRIQVFCAGSYVFGAEKKTLALMAGLQKRGHYLHCIASAWNDGDFIRRLEERGIPYRTVYLGKVTKSVAPRHIWWLANTLVRWPGALARCWIHLRRFRPDVVVISNRDAIFLLSPLLDPKRAIYQVSELADHSAWTLRLYRFIDQRIGHFVGVSESIRRRLLALGIHSEKVSVVYNGMETNGEPTPIVRSQGAGPAIIGIIGQIGEWKGHDDLLEALRLLNERRVHFRCIVVGRGEEGYVGSLKTRVDQYGLTPNVTWRGFVSGTDSIYVGMDICVIPSRIEEAFGNVAIEAGIRAIPVVATRRGGLAEIVIDGESGYLVDPENPTDLADRLTRLIEDPALRLRLGEAARRRVEEHFTVDQMVAGIERLCREMAGRN